MRADDGAGRDLRLLGLGWSAAEIRAAERPLLEAGAPLMARAAAGLAREISAVLVGRAGPVLVLVGTGDNGGDALFAAARLASGGTTVELVLVGSSAHEEGMRAAVGAGARLLADSAPETIASAAVRAAVIVDGVLGIAATHAVRLRQGALDAVRAVRDALTGAADPATVVAVDLPSGVGADDGGVPEMVLPADRTVVFGAMKAGLLFGSSADVRGEVVLVDIDLADSLREVTARTRSPYGRVLDAASPRRLHPRLRAYFSRIPKDATGVGEGRFDTYGVPNPLLRPLLGWLAPLGVLAPVSAADVAFGVRNRPGRVRIRRSGAPAPAVRATRTIALPGGRAFTMRDRVSVVGDRLVDDVGIGGLVRVVLDAEVDGTGALHLVSTAVALRVGPLVVPVPSRIAPVLELEERFDDALDAQRVRLALDVPVIGRVLAYTGTFRYRVLR